MHWLGFCVVLVLNIDFSSEFNNCWTIDICAKINEYF